MPIGRKKHNPFYSSYQFHETGAKIPKFVVDVGPERGKSLKALKKVVRKGTISEDDAKHWYKK